MPYLDEAVQSALAQRDVAVEVLIVDDGSSDGSLACAEAWAAREPRVKLLRTPQNSGPGGARNVALETMRGSWYAVLDSDDRIDPDRCVTLIAAALAHGADLVADDLRIFGDGIPDSTFLAPNWPPAGFPVSLDTYFRSSAMFGKHPNFGFLKPMIRRSTLTGAGIRYNPDLRIAEDDELIVRLLLSGARYLVVPRPMYYYRKHAASISHRLSLADAERMLASERLVRTTVVAAGAETPAYRRRWHALHRAVSFTRSIDALKRRRPIAAIRALAQTPGAVALYTMPIGAKLRRLFRR